ncbi:hypothetical protein ACH61_00696 [Rathayibacter tanaceti]|uniref:Uncharacterized protein n=1 Tax=Rathayibacter tanaceti TaxID=1671680 RepID=A0A162GJB1_9MICO|nr:hypothetical protein ACH61_00696 [Rathayibacter tanaceti]
MKPTGVTPSARATSWFVQLVATTRSADSTVVLPNACSTVTGRPSPVEAALLSEVPSEPASAPPAQAVSSRAARPIEATAVRRRGVRVAGTMILRRRVRLRRLP